MSGRLPTNPKSSVSRPSWLHDPDVIVFASEQELAVGAVQQHGLKEWFGNLFYRTKEEVRADWERVVGQIEFLLDGVSAITTNYDLDEITFELGFSAEGKIVFVAKAGVTTTISAKFRRKQLSGRRVEGPGSAVRKRSPR